MRGDGGANGLVRGWGRKEGNGARGLRCRLLVQHGQRRRSGRGKSFSLKLARLEKYCYSKLFCRDRSLQETVFCSRWDALRSDHAQIRHRRCSCGYHHGAQVSHTICIASPPAPTHRIRGRKEGPTAVFGRPFGAVLLVVGRSTHLAATARRYLGLVMPQRLGVAFGTHRGQA